MMVTANRTEVMMKNGRLPFSGLMKLGVTPEGGGEEGMFVRAFSISNPLLEVNLDMLSELKRL